jgi:predicted nuclease of predicted toxin-antitoxin system
MAETPRLFIAIYTDEDITSELAPALRERGFDAQSAAEANLLGQSDEKQLDYAFTHGMAILTCNSRHYLKLARMYATTGRPHGGIILSAEQYSHKRFGTLLHLVLRLLNSLTAEEIVDSVLYLQKFQK